MSDSTPTTTAKSRWGAGRVVRIVLGVQLIIAVCAGAVWYHERSTGAQLAPSEVVQFNAPVSGPVSLEAALPLAQATAKRWNPRAELFNASQELDWSPLASTSTGVDQPGGGWLVYVFVAPQHRTGEEDTAASLSIQIDRNSGNVVVARPISWSSQPTAPDLTFGKYHIDSSAATTIAENVAGRAFRHGCATDRHMSWMSLVATTPKQPVWLVTYPDTRDPDHNGLAVRIDAQTGKVLSQVQQAPACGT